MHGYSGKRAVETKWARSERDCVGGRQKQCSGSMSSPRKSVIAWLSSTGSPTLSDAGEMSIEVDLATNFYRGTFRASSSPGKRVLRVSGVCNRRSQGGRDKLHYVKVDGETLFVSNRAGRHVASCLSKWSHLGQGTPGEIQSGATGSETGRVCSRRKCQAHLQAQIQTSDPLQTLLGHASGIRQTQMRSS